MDIQTISASRFKSYSACEQKFFLENVLGIRYPSFFKATPLGSISHSCLELLAKAKKAHQEDEPYYESRTFGKIDINVDVQDLIKRVYSHYTKKEYITYDWNDEDFKKVNKYVNKVMEYNGGGWNPLKQNVVDIEKYFAIPVEEPWAKTSSGEYLKLNGYIDLVVQVDENVYEIIDYKTGQLKDFNTGVKIDHEYLKTDIQLLQYYWAAHHLYGFDKHFLVTMFYIKEGGLFTLHFDHNQLMQLESRIRRIFEHISNNNKPRQQISWKCRKFCPFSQNYSNNPIIKDWSGGVNKEIGGKACLCDEVYYITQTEGINSAIQKYSQKKSQKN